MFRQPSSLSISVLVGDWLAAPVTDTGNVVMGVLTEVAVACRRAPDLKLTIGNTPTSRAYLIYTRIYTEG